MSVFFIGAFNQISQEMSSNSSVAGSKVQMEIISSLSNLYDENSVKSVVFPELASWPKNKLFISKKRFENVVSLPIINLPVVKRFLFSIQALFLIIKHKPEFIVQYNTTFLMNSFMFFYKFFCGKRILILQDLNSNVTFNIKLLLNPVDLFNYFGAKTIKRSFDYFIPISNSLVNDLKLPVERCSIWQGGVTNLELINSFRIDKKYIAVFAGALEEYNGIDILVSRWVELNSDIELHIFGTGSLSDKICEASELNKNIKYHGFKSPDIVASYVQSALLNFCLRYSKGIDQDYFFPSKFFDLLMCQGNFLCNNFNNIPDDLKRYIVFLDDDLLNLKDFLDFDFPDDASVSERKKHLLLKYTWAPFLKSIFNCLENN